ncbi:hypothetical protein OHB54_13610 [Streptomyces sp. NBC_01007]|nr:hypothetical protein OHB54_13610 [Streptomyces sp. NBC_01007]
MVFLSRWEFMQPLALGITDRLNLVASVGGLLVALSTLILSVVALRLTKEQARSHLFPAPSLFTDPAAQGIVLRNFGAGVMLNIWINVTIIDPGRPPIEITRYVSNLGQGESAVVVGIDTVQQIAIVEIRVKLNFDNVHRHPMSESMTLTAEQLGALGT